MDPSPSSPRDSGVPPTASGPDAAASPAPVPAPATPAPARTRRPAPRRLTLVLAATGAAVVLVLAVVWAGTGYRYEPYAGSAVTPAPGTPTDERALKAQIAKLKSRDRDLSARLKAAAPRGVYVVIDQTQNRLYLKKDDETLLEAVCSAGSGMVLKETGGKNRQWMFDTPRGRFEVQTLLVNPVWAKPDWAFVEEGQPIPKNPADRLESGTLGEYALYFGDGFMIHGTLYERLLGRAVSHGCIRVGRDDLRKVWAHARVGMRIYIY
jgi:lipoprotein-anchoring transpeptidase ErfK/SrfK